MFRSLLIPVDGSGHARRALSIACQLVAADGVLHLLNVQEIPTSTYGIATIGTRPPLDTFSKEVAEEAGRAALDSMMETMPAHQCRVETGVRVGSPAHTIIEEAERLGVEAIVMGSRGLSDFRGMMVGSVSHRVSHTAPCTVISVHDAPHVHGERACAL
ncbi:universal stress protein [Kushneria phosphatilytica]|uniref:Universal stress protein n=1 Tax=Kushneria phosphatilytica TaxID=657387 RepID=A0A1S1NUK3_9GAMM|nr:universal stress protein [Kushneria phosphatilytica]OHV10039.1 hypothetical protein BH688_10570 [Kushneria phosphatilytica]QEL11727.1 universal stress protein [Kushneria phosphatilytica]